MAEEEVKCCFCGKKSKKSDMSFLCGVYSHKECDEKYFEKQEKRVKYLGKNETDARI